VGSSRAKLAVSSQYFVVDSHSPATKRNVCKQILPLYGQFIKLAKDVGEFYKHQNNHQNQPGGGYKFVVVFL
jgi:hypothetical protein